MLFDKSFIEHIIDLKQGKAEKISGLYYFLLIIISNKVFSSAVTFFEYLIGFFLCLPLPVYRSLVLFFISNLPGSPYFTGNILRGIYWSRRLKSMGKNTVIEQGVNIRNPGEVELDEFVLIDKNVALEAGKIKIGKRVHIAENCVISGGGDFIMEDYSCIAHSTAVVTATDTPAKGFRASGPMVPWNQRNVLFGKVVIKKDAFVGMGARILPDVVINEGAVVAAGAFVNKDVSAWDIVAGIPAKVIGKREPVKFQDI